MLDIHIVVVVPIIWPVFWPRVNDTEPKTAVLEAWISTNNHHGVAINTKRVARAKVAAITVLRNPVAVVSATLVPIAVLRFPVMCPMPLPSGLLFSWLSMLLLLRGPIGLFLFLWLGLLLLLLSR